MNYFSAFLLIFVGVPFLFDTAKWIIRLVSGFSRQRKKWVKAFSNQLKGGHNIRSCIASAAALVFICYHASQSDIIFRAWTDTRVKPEDSILVRELVPDLDFKIYRPIFRYHARLKESIQKSYPRRARAKIQDAIDKETRGAIRSAARGEIVLPYPSLFLPTGTNAKDDYFSTGHRLSCIPQKRRCYLVLIDDFFLDRVLELGTADFTYSAKIFDPRLEIEHKGGSYFIGLYVSKVVQSQTDFDTAIDAAIRRSFRPNIFEVSSGADITYRDFSRKGTPAVPNTLAYEIRLHQSDKVLRLIYCRPKPVGAVDRVPVFCSKTEGSTLRAMEMSSEGNDWKVGDDYKRLPAPLNASYLIEFDDDDVSKAFLAWFEVITGKKESAPSFDDFGQDEMVAQVIADYFTILGSPRASSDFHGFLDKNPSLKRWVEQKSIASTEATRDQKIDALQRQQQLWAWHSFAPYIRDEIFSALSKQLIQLGLAIER